MSFQEQKPFSTGIVLNLIVAGGITWIVHSEICHIPESLGWLVNIYLTQTSYATSRALLQTSTAKAIGRWVLWAILQIAVLSFAFISYIGNMFSEVLRRSKNQKRLITALDVRSTNDKPSSVPIIGSSTEPGKPRPFIKSSYHYQELRETDEIRLLEIFPAAGPEEVGPLRGRLIHARLSNFPEFTALSYCWNDMDYSSPIEDDRDSIFDMQTEGSLILTQNLFNGLQSARKEGHFRNNLFWVDQISINQEDLHEKSSQVVLMTDIFKQADLVLVWLGNDNPTRDGDKALQFADVISNRINEKRLLSPELDFFVMSFTSNNVGLPPIHAATIEYMSLIKLLMRPWFQRSWVVQEISLNANKRVLCGSREISFDSLAMALYFCTQVLDFLMDAVSLEARDAFRAMIQSSVFNRIDSAPSSSRLLDVLVRHRGCKATLASDKILAFLNISEDCDLLGIKADYTISTRALFIKAAVAMVTYYDHLDILSAANAWPNGHTNGLVTLETLDTPQPSQARPSEGDRDLNPDHLPSWVPDWSLPTFAPSLQSRGEFGEYFSNYQATGGSNKSVQFRLDNTQLGLEGHVLDRIISVGLGFVDDPGLDIGYHYRTIKSWGDMCGAWDKRGIYKLTQEDILTAFSNTLTCGGKDVTQGSPKPSAIPSTDPNIKPEGLQHKDWLGGNDSFEAQFNQLWVVLRVNWVLERMWPRIAGHPLIYKALSSAFIILAGIWGNTLEFFGLSLPRAPVSSGFRHRVFASITRRRFVCTERGLIGLASPQVQPGDFVALFAGGHVPIVVRDAQGFEGSRVLWDIVGDAYVHGVMFGEAFLPESQRRTMWIS